MVFFKTETQYEYIAEKDGKFVIDPMFYSAYHYVRKALINILPEDEQLNNIETDEEYYSINVKLRPNMILKNYTARDVETRGLDLKKVDVSPFFFELMKVFPRYINYKFYIDAESVIPEMDVAARGPVYHNSYPHNFHFPEDMSTVKERSYKRGVDAEYDILNINFLYIYLALGDAEFPTIANFTINSRDEYLKKLEEALTAIDTVMKKATPSKNALQTLLPNAGNEARASFYQLLTPKVKCFEEYIREKTRRGEYKKFSYPAVIEKKSANDEHYTKELNPMSYLKVEELTLEEKLTDSRENYQTLNLSVLLDIQMQIAGYNLRMIRNSYERGNFYYAQNIRDDYFSRLVVNIDGKISNSLASVLG